MAEREMWALPNGAILYNVHPAAQCEGTPCWIHHPTDHHMREWPLIQRGSGLIERECLHGVGHPDPDSLWFFEHIVMIEGLDAHDCDGCCRSVTTEGERT